ncbi:hypothetical protein Kisp02_57460 [Kineosporia sp. NBRC 101731]|nr:hypothetical protein Kisp02_57460 [Kineosporia sp. NBRC 101731]
MDCLDERLGRLLIDAAHLDVQRYGEAVAAFFTLAQAGVGAHSGVGDLEGSRSSGHRIRLPVG